VLQANPASPDVTGNQAHKEHQAMDSQEQQVMQERQALMALPAKTAFLELQVKLVLQDLLVSVLQVMQV